MAYFDLNDDICQYKFNILQNDDTQEYKIMYIIRNRTFGITRNFMAYIPKQDDKLYKYVKDIDIDDELLSSVDRKVKNPIYNNIKDVITNCYAPVFAIPKFTYKNKYYYRVKSTNRIKDCKNLVIKLSKRNIWEIKNNKQQFMNIVFNHGLGINNNGRPDTVNIFAPLYRTDVLPYSLKNLHDMYQDFSTYVTAFKNKTPVYNSLVDSYVLKFNVNCGIVSEKNSCIIRMSQNNDAKSHMELLKLSHNLVCVIYKTPFSSVHAFGYGVARMHATKKF